MFCVYKMCLHMHTTYVWLLHFCHDLMINSIKIKYLYKDSIVAILPIQKSIIIIQTTEYNNFMLDAAWVKTNTC